MFSAIHGVHSPCFNRSCCSVSSSPIRIAFDKLVFRAPSISLWSSLISSTAFVCGKFLRFISLQYKSPGKLTASDNRRVVTDSGFLSYYFQYFIRSFQHCFHLYYTKTFGNGIFKPLVYRLPLVPGGSIQARIVPQTLSPTTRSRGQR